MKKIMLSTILIMVALIGIISYKMSADQPVNALAIANIEALSNANETDSTCSFEKVEKNEKKHSLNCSGTGHQCCKLD